MTLLIDLKVAIVADHGVNQTELVIPREFLEKAGLTVEIISIHWPEVKAWHEKNWSIRIKVDKLITDAFSEDYQGIIIPGGLLHADALRMDAEISSFIKQQFASGKTVAAVSHGVQVLINSMVLEGREVTACKSLQKDVENAGGVWSDHKVVSDNGLITCCSAAEIEELTNLFLEDLRRGIHQRTETII